MATGVQSWSTTAATNATADSNANFAEGMAPSAVNDSCRGAMSSVAKWRDDKNGTIATTGGTTVYAITTNQVMSTNAAGNSVCFGANTSNGATVTLNVDSAGAKPLRAYPGVELAAGVLKAGVPYTATYFTSNSGEWLLHGTKEAFPTGTAMLFVQTTAPTGWTKSTTHNDKALRVVSGTVGTGGGQAFTDTFTSTTTGSHTLSTAEIAAHTHTATTGNESAAHSHSETTAFGGVEHTHTFSATSGTESADHTHSYTGPSGSAGFGAGGGAAVTGTAGATSGGKSATHTHSVSGTTGNSSAYSHTHTFNTGANVQNHTHDLTTASTGGGGGHTHTLSLAVSYIDVIVATKD